MQCPKCGSQNFDIVSLTEGKIKKRGCLMSLFHILIALFTCGLWLLIPILSGGSKGKIKSRTVGVCKNCGNKFNI